MTLKRILAWIVAAIVCCQPALALTAGQKIAVLNGVQGWSIPGSSADLFLSLNGGSCTSHRISAPCSSLIVTSRNSPETCTSLSGLVTYAANNTPCITNAGLQVFQASTNLLFQSNAFSTSPWGLSAGVVTLTGNAGAAPDGTNTAWQHASNATFGYINQSPQAATVASANYTASIYFKPGTYTRVRVQFGDITSANAVYAVFNGSTGVFVSSTTVGTGAYVNSGSQVLPNGWIRIWVIGSITGTNGTILFDNFSGTTGNCLIWGAQLEQSSFPTPYIPTTTSSATRAADNITATGALLTAILNAKAARFVTNGVNVSASGNRLFDINVSTQQASFTTATNIALTSNSGTNFLSFAPGSGTAAGLVKTAFGFDGSGLTGIANGGVKATNAISWGAPSGTVTIGNSQGLNRALNGNLLRMTFGPVKGMFDAMTTGSNPQ